MLETPPPKKSWAIRILSLLGVLVLISIFYFAWYTPKYGDLVEKLRQDAKCTGQAKTFAEKWSQEITKNDDQLSITTVPGKSRVYFNTATQSCLVHLRYTSQSDTTTINFEALYNLKTGVTLTQNSTTTTNSTGKSNISNPNFEEELKSFTGN